MDFRRKPGYRPETGYGRHVQPASGDPGVVNRKPIMPFQQCAPAVALVLALPVVVFAEELPVFVGEEIVVTPTRSPQKLSETLAATTVLNRREIDASGAVDLPALLQGLPGVEIAQAGGFGSQTAFRLRGAEADHTLVLIDGLRMNSVSAGTTAIEHLPLAEVVRIEIVRGNVSSVYGSEAIGGVVRIFTRKGAGPIRPRIEAGAGTHENRQINASVGGVLPSGLSLYLGAGQTSGGGFSAVKKQYIPAPSVFVNADLDDDVSRNTHLSFQLSQRVGDYFNWGVSTLRTWADVEYDGEFSNHADQQLGQYSAFVEGRPTETWTSRLTLARSLDNLDNDLNGAPGNRFDTRINQAHWENTFNLDHQTLRFGLEAQHQKLKSNQVFSQTSRKALSAYAGWGLKLDAHGLDISARYDDYSDFGGHATGRVAYGYRFTPALKGFAAVASAFKAPTFNDLYLDFPPFYFSNPNLEPERSKNAELGFNYAAAGQSIQATLFASRASDMIVIDPVTFATTVNLDKSRNHGVEMSWNGKLAGMDARAALTWQNPEDAKTGLPLLRRAQRFGSAALSDRIGKFGWRGELIASGAHPDVHVSNFTRTRVPGYAVLNLSADYAISRDWKLTGHVLNVLNAEYSQVHGYATPGRGFRLELAYSPK